MSADLAHAQDSVYSGLLEDVGSGEYGIQSTEELALQFFVIFL